MIVDVISSVVLPLIKTPNQLHKREPQPQRGTANGVTHLKVHNDPKTDPCGTTIVTLNVSSAASTELR